MTKRTHSWCRDHDASVFIARCTAVRLGVLVLAATALAAATLPARPAQARRVAVPPDPLPQGSKRPKEARRHEAILAADGAYRRVLSGPPSGKLKTLLTAVSCMLVGDELPPAIAEAVRASGLEGAARNLHDYYTAVGRYPADFTKRFEHYLKATARRPHLGVWGKVGIHDYAALAAWHNKRKAEYQRALLAARRAAVGAWAEIPDAEPPRRLAYLAHERHALERLDRIGKLNAGERKRLEVLKNPPRGLGEKIQVGPLAYVVDEADATDTLGFGMARLDARPGSRFVVIHCSVANRSDARTPIQVDGFRLIDGSQRRYRPSNRAIGALAMVEDGGEVALSEVEAGDGHDLAVAFEVPAAATARPLTLNLPPPRGGRGAAVTFKVDQDAAPREEPPSVLDTM